MHRSTTQVFNHPRRLDNQQHVDPVIRFAIRITDSECSPDHTK